MIGDAINYPTQRDDWLETILIGGGLFILSMVPFVGIIGALIINGYSVRVLRSAAKEEETPPVFDEWAELLVDGLKYVGISIVYVLIPMIISIMLLFFMLSLEMIIGVLIALLPLILGLYFLPAALTNFALSESVDSAFDILTITGAAFTGQYFAAIVLAALIGFVLGLIGSLFTVLLVGFGILFYQIIVVHYIFARGCCPALRQDTNEEFAT